MNTLTTKQKRRGGIETGAPGRRRPAGGGRKQKRRGGIETRQRGLRKVVVRMKQKRRGGIETGVLLRWGTNKKGEAETPWWH